MILRSLFFSVVLLTIPIFSGATSSTIPSYQNDEKPSTWTLVHEQDGIRVYFQILEDDNQRQLQVKMENQGSETTRGIWSINHNGTPISITLDDMQQANVLLPAGQSIIPSEMAYIEVDTLETLNNFSIQLTLFTDEK